VVARKARTYHRTQIIQWMSSVLSDLYPFAQAEEAISRLPRPKSFHKSLRSPIAFLDLVSSRLFAGIVASRFTTRLYDTIRYETAHLSRSPSIARDSARASLFLVRIRGYADTRIRGARCSRGLCFSFSLCLESLDGSRRVVQVDSL